MPVWPSLGRTLSDWRWQMSQKPTSGEFGLPTSTERAFSVNLTAPVEPSGWSVTHLRDLSHNLEADLVSIRWGKGG